MARNHLRNEITKSCNYIRHMRSAAETILRRAQWLEAADQALLGQVLERGATCREVARLRGVKVRSIERRVRRLASGLVDRRVARVLRRCESWDPLTRQIGVRRWVRQESLARIAGDLGIKLHEVRTRIRSIDLLLEEATRRPKVRGQRSELRQSRSEEVAPGSEGGWPC